MIRYLQTVAGDKQVGGIQIEGNKVRLLGAASVVFSAAQRIGGEPALRRLADGGWSNGYLYLAPMDTGS